MAKESFSTRIEAELKVKIKDLNEFHTNEEIVEAGFKSLTTFPEFEEVEEVKNSGINFNKAPLKKEIGELINLGGTTVEDLIFIGYKELTTRAIQESVGLKPTNKREQECLDLIQNMNLTKEKIIAGATELALKTDPKFLKEVAAEIENSKQYFVKKDFNLAYFSTYLNGNESNFTSKLSTLSTWIPYTTLVEMESGDLYYVTEVDHKFDRISFGVVGKATGKTIPLSSLIKMNGRVKKVFHLKEKPELAAVKKEIEALKAAELKKTKQGKRGK